jgi:hypothetical protein
MSAAAPVSDAVSRLPERGRRARDVLPHADSGRSGRAYSPDPDRAMSGPYLPASSMLSAAGADVYEARERDDGEHSGYNSDAVEELERDAKSKDGEQREHDDPFQGKPGPDSGSRFDDAEFEDAPPPVIVAVGNGEEPEVDEDWQYRISLAPQLLPAAPAVSTFYSLSDITSLAAFALCCTFFHPLSHERIDWQILSEYLIVIVSLCMAKPQRSRNDPLRTRHLLHSLTL